MHHTLTCLQQLLLIAGTCIYVRLLDLVNCGLAIHSYKLMTLSQLYIFPAAMYLVVVFNNMICTLCEDGTFRFWCAYDCGSAAKLSDVFLDLWGCMLYIPNFM